MRKLLTTSVALLLLSTVAQAADPVVINDKARFPEGPMMLGDTLYYVEYGGHTVVAWDGKENKVVWQQEGCGPSAVTQLPDGQFAVTCYDSGSLALISADWQTTKNIAQDSAGGALQGPNDLTLDGKGGLYFTASGPWESGPIVGKVFHMTADGVITEMANDLHYANGIVLSDTGLLLVNESEAARVISFAVGADGSLSDRRLYLRLTDIGVAHSWGPYPDGLKLDAHGNLWIGTYSAGQIIAVDAEKKVLALVDVPSTAAPNFTFSADGKTLYIMAVDDTTNAPYLGKVYAVENPVP